MPGITEHTAEDAAVLEARFGASGTVDGWKVIRATSLLGWVVPVGSEAGVGRLDHLLERRDPLRIQVGIAWMIDEICARGLGAPNCVTESLRMKWSADMPSQAVSAARLLTSG